MSKRKMGLRASVRAGSSPDPAAGLVPAPVGGQGAELCSPERGVGFHGDHLHGPDRRIYLRVQERITPGRAQELLRAGAVMAVDDCGCGGGCGLEWPEAAERADLSRRPPSVTKRRFGWLEEWKDESGELLLLQNGDVRWP